MGNQRKGPPVSQLIYDLRRTPEFQISEEDDQVAAICDEAAEALEQQAAEIERLRAERDAAVARVAELEARETHFAQVLSVADGGQYRNDWDAAIRRVIAERDNAYYRGVKAAIDLVRKQPLEWGGIVGEDAVYRACDQALAAWRAERDETSAHAADDRRNITEQDR